jgi:hypothetical protein
MCKQHPRPYGGSTTNLQQGGGGRRRIVRYPYPPVGFRLSLGTAAAPAVWTAEPLPPPPFERFRLFVRRTPTPLSKIGMASLPACWRFVVDPWAYQNGHVPGYLNICDRPLVIRELTNTAKTETPLLCCCCCWSYSSPRLSLPQCSSPHKLLSNPMKTRKKVRGQYGFFGEG